MDVGQLSVFGLLLLLLLFIIIIIIIIKDPKG